MTVVLVRWKCRLMLPVRSVNGRIFAWSNAMHGWWIDESVISPGRMANADANGCSPSDSRWWALLAGTHDSLFDVLSIYNKKKITHTHKHVHTHTHGNVSIRLKWKSDKHLPINLTKNGFRSNNLKYLLSILPNMSYRHRHIDFFVCYNVHVFSHSEWIYLFYFSGSVAEEPGAGSTSYLLFTI